MLGDYKKIIIEKKTIIYYTHKLADPIGYVIIRFMTSIHICVYRRRSPYIIIIVIIVSIVDFKF